MTDRHEVGPDVDLAVEEVRDRQGRRVTDEYAERAAEEALRHPPVSRRLAGML